MESRNRAEEKKRAAHIAGRHLFQQRRLYRDDGLNFDAIVISENLLVVVVRRAKLETSRTSPCTKSVPSILCPLAGRPLVAAIYMPRVEQHNNKEPRPGAVAPPIIDFPFRAGSYSLHAATVNYVFTCHFMRPVGGGGSKSRRTQDDENLDQELLLERRDQRSCGSFMAVAMAIKGAFGYDNARPYRRADEPFKYKKKERKRIVKGLRIYPGGLQLSRC